jgi:hypothetical protein
VVELCIVLTPHCPLVLHPCTASRCTAPLCCTAPPDMVTSALAAKLGLSNPTRLRLTQHNTFSSAPQRQPMRWVICLLACLLACETETLQQAGFGVQGGRAMLLARGSWGQGVGERYVAAVDPC